MASFAVNAAFCFLIAAFCFIGNNVEAREGKLFFSKFTHNSKVAALPQAPAPDQAHQANGRLGDGPFGPGSGMIPQTKESWPTTTDEEFEKLMATFDEEKNNNQLPEEFEKEEESRQERYNNYNDNRRGYGNEEKRQGMRETRFAENGMYYYDTRGRSYGNTPSRSRYESARGNDHPYEFDTMEEYYKSLEGSQEEFQP